mgnify:FL=1
MQTPNPAPPQVPAALCGLFPGARVTMTSIPEMGAGTAECRMENGCWSVRFDTAEFGWWTPEMLSLLLDSPLAVCHAARWLATRLGWRLNMLSAVQWVSESKAFSRNVRRTFVLSYSFHRHWFHDDPLLLRAIERGAINKFGLEALTHVPGIAPKDASDMSEAERVAALAAACVAVGGAA